MHAAQVHGDESRGPCHHQCAFVVAAINRGFDQIQRTM
jgi:hypothetical protein